MAPTPPSRAPLCGWQAGSDDVPCGFPTGHSRPHRVRSPYADTRWIDYVTPPGRDRPVEVARDGRWAREVDPGLYRWGRLAYDGGRRDVLVRVVDLGGGGVTPAGLQYGCSLLEGENRIGEPRLVGDALGVSREAASYGGSAEDAAIADAVARRSSGAAEVGPQRMSPAERHDGHGPLACHEGCPGWSAMVAERYEAPQVAEPATLATWTRGDLEAWHRDFHLRELQDRNREVIDRELAILGGSWPGPVIEGGCVTCACRSVDGAEHYDWCPRLAEKGTRVHVCGPASCEAPTAAQLEVFGTSPGAELTAVLGAPGARPLDGAAARRLAVDLAQAAAKACAVPPGDDISSVRRAIEKVLVSGGVAAPFTAPGGRTRVATTPIPPAEVCEHGFYPEPGRCPAGCTQATHAITGQGVIPPAGDVPGEPA